MNDYINAIVVDGVTYILRDNTAYSHATDANKIAQSQASGLYKFAVTSDGHIASVVAVTAQDITSLGVQGLPTVTASDNGKILRVVNGAWATVQLPSASGVSF